MGKIDFVIHCNPKMDHQRLYAEAWLDGIRAHGDDGVITSSPGQVGDYHFIMGPHFAKEFWLEHPNVVLLDRCFWGDDLENVTIGWMNPIGGRYIPHEFGPDRDKPDLKPIKCGNKSIYLADYEHFGKLEKVWLKYNVHPDQFGPRMALRQHPATDRRLAPIEPLPKELKKYDIAIGFHTSALITAAIEGLKIVCFDPNNPVWPVANHEIKSYDTPYTLKAFDRKNWLNQLSYMQYTYHEVKIGVAWDMLKNNAHQ